MEGSEEALGLATNNDTGRGDLCPSIPKFFDADEDDIYIDDMDVKNAHVMTAQIFSSLLEYPRANARMSVQVKA